MLFVSFSSAFVVRQGIGNWDAKTGLYVRDWHPIALALLTINTMLLVASSGSLELARRASRVRLAPAAPYQKLTENINLWLGATIILGSAFLAGQFIAWQDMKNNGLRIYSDPASAFFYLLTSSHAIHLVAGIIALLVAALTAFWGRPYHTQALVLDATSWYWHGIAVLWIYLFALVTGLILKMNSSST